MAKNIAFKGKRTLLAILSSMYKYGPLQHHVYFKIFYTEVLPITLYGCELWGFQEHESIEVVHGYACKRYMCLRAKTIPAAILGDCGRYP